MIYTGAILGYLMWPAMIVVSYVIIKRAMRNMRDK